MKCYLLLTFNTAGLTHALKGVSLRPPIRHFALVVRPHVVVVEAECHGLAYLESAFIHIRSCFY